MNEPSVKTTKEFVFQRLSEPFPFSTDDTPLWLWGAVGLVLLLLAALTFVLPLVRTLKSVLAGLVVRGAVYVPLALLGVVAWFGLTNATDKGDAAARTELFWAMVAGEVLLALLFGVSGLLTVLSGDRLSKGGNTEGVAFGTLLTVLFGRTDTSKATAWHYAAAGCRTLFFLIPLTCMVISRGFEHDAEPLWWFFTGGMFVTATLLTLLMYQKDATLTAAGGLHPLAGTAIAAGAVVLGGGFVFALGVLLLSAVVLLASVFRRGGFVGWLRVGPLALLRTLTFAALAFCFLLPAMQPWETTEKRSKVVILFDVSPSMVRHSDEISRDPNAKLKTRADKVLDFLTSQDGEFVAKLLEKNPVTVYRFGSTLDADPEVIARGPADKPAANNWKKDEWEAFVAYDYKAWVTRYTAPDGKGFSDEAKAALQSAPAWLAGPGDAQWVLDWAKADEVNTKAEELADRPTDTPADASRKAADRKLLAAVREKAAKRVDVARIIAQGSAVPDSVTAAINREQANMTQAVIVFSDGRSNMSSDQAVAETARRAKEANIPVYTVSVGSAREVVSLVISDLQAPDRTQPDEPTQVTVAVDGVGFKQNDQVEATLELFLPGKDPKTDPADYEMKQTVTFGPGETPHGETTFILDAEEFAKKAAVTLIEEISPPKPGRKWQLKKGQWKVRAKVPTDPREIFREPNHLSPIRTMEVIDKPLRVLLAASAPSREYQILRQLLVREVEQKRAELSIFMQNDGGTKGTIVQDVPPGRLLLKFPDEFDVSKDTSVGAGGDPGSDAETQRQRAKYNNLNEYDLIICFDPNWNERDDANAFRIPNNAFTKLKTWSQDYGGGLIYVAGPFYTASLVRANEEGGRLRPLLDMLPVEPDDIVASDDPLIKINGRTTARRLKFNPPKDSDLLRLDDLTPQRDEAAKAVAGWELFFTGGETTPKKTGGDNCPYLYPTRGFYTYYPVKKVKPLAASLAEFVNIDEQKREALRPFYAVGPSGAGRTAWIGSGEIFRLRAVPEVGISFYDKFWLQLARYTSAKRTSGAKARGDVLMSKEIIAGTPIRVRARLLQSSGEPYPETDLDKPKLTIEKLDQNGEVKERFGPFDVLKPSKLGAKFEGYYQGVVMPDPAKMVPGEFRYRVSVTKADLPDPITGEFILKSANPELDNTKPDLQALRDLASPVKAALDGEPDPAKRRDIAKDLGIADENEVKTGRAKLAFALDDPAKVRLIPSLIRSRSESPQNRGVVDPLWDDSYDPAADKTTDWLRTELAAFQLSASSKLVFRLWLPVTLVLLLTLALTWVLRTRADLPKSGILGVLEGIATAAIGLIFLPLGLAFALPPVFSLYERVFGPMPDAVKLGLFAACALPGLGMVGVYVFAGKSRPAVGSVALTLAMLAQALAAALAVWYGNPFPVGYAVLALAAFLCTEWTSRKLLRLA